VENKMEGRVEKQKEKKVQRIKIRII